MDPADVLQRLEFSLRLDRLLLNGCDPDIHSRQDAEPPMSIVELGKRLGVLRRIKRKQIFRVDLKVEQWRIRLNDSAQLSDVLRSIL